jgi:hypothetical protein
MSKDISTLVKDIYDVLENDTNHSLALGEGDTFAKALLSHYQGAVEGRGSRQRKDRVIYASEIGKPCVRAIAYDLDPEVEKEVLTGATLYKFLYGNIIEELTLQLARSAGHEVGEEQKEFDVQLPNGWRVRGRQDATIDGVVTDVKSASGFAFKKFKENGVNSNTDTFGYADQLGFYWTQQPEYHDKDPAFLFVNKELGKLHVEHVKVDPSSVMKRAELKTDQLDKFIKTGVYPSRLNNAEVPEGASGNMKLCTVCSYCGFKKTCWPNARTFAYSSGPVTLTHVAREPKVPEIMS